MKDWKTTINGILALLIVVATALLASGSPLIGQKATLYLMLGLGVARAIVGFLQNDSIPLAVLPSGAVISKPPISSAATKIVGLLLIGTLCIPLAGCSNWERTSFQTLAATKATLDSAQADYESGKLIPHSAVAYKAINDAKLVDVQAVDAMINYEKVKASNSTGPALTDAQSAVDVLLLEIPPLIATVQALRK